MNDQELQQIWKRYDEKINAMLKVNRQQAIDITRLKVTSNLASLKPIKWFAVVAGVIWCLVLGLIFVVSILHQPPHVLFILFMAGLLLVNAIGVCTYIYHLVLIDRADHAREVLEVQRTLHELKCSTLRVTRILILQMPFYFALHLFIATDAGVAFWAINAVIILAAVLATLWLYFHINERNHHGACFRFLFGDREYESVARSIDLMDQIREVES